MKVVDTCDLCSRRGIIWSNENNTRICKKCNNRIELDLLLNAPPETEAILDMNSKDDYTKKDTLKGNIWDANWTVNIDHQNNEVQVFTDEKVNYTWFFTIGTITPENELIARLIAAAPKMLKFFTEFDGANSLLAWDDELHKDSNLEFLNEIGINSVPVKKITES